MGINFNWHHFEYFEKLQDYFVHFFWPPFTSFGAYPARTHCCPVDCLGRPRPLLLLSPTRFLLSSSLHNFLSSSFCSIAFSLPSLDLGQAELLTRGGWGGGLLLRPRSQLGKSLLLQSLLLSPFLPLPLLLLQSDKSLLLCARCWNFWKCNCNCFA